VAEAPAAVLEADVDVLIVGAGLSGVGAACHLRRECPGKSVAIIESRDSIGGTWDLFRYPGIRSDSDMFTLGYDFRPWTHPKSIADGPSILQYVRETASAYGVDQLIRFGRRMVSADWSSADSTWTVDVERVDTGERVRYRCRFLFMCSGYYRYDEGYSPDFAGQSDFRGDVVHPQHWPDGLDYTGKRVVVIGSGATAVTLVPAMAREATHVTMLQRSPSYIVSLPAHDRLADLLRAKLPARLAYSVVRRKNVTMQRLSYTLSRKRPGLMKKLIRKGLVASLPPDFEIDKHFSPTYNPWDQRLCLVPDGDLFQTLSAGKASIVTSAIDRFVAEGIRLASGEVLPADVIVTATGLNMQIFGGASLSLDGAPVSMPDLVSYRGTMLSGVPNLAMAVGYTNASWTLKCDLIARWVCRLLQHLDEHGYAAAAPLAPPADQPTSPLIDLKSGYVQRAAEFLPKQGEVPPWRLYQNYPKDVKLMREAPIDDGVLQFSTSRVSTAARAAG
jgi:cation diffusion facilitator CzcD-associated flavoprotein CzcO